MFYERQTNEQLMKKWGKKKQVMSKDPNMYLPWAGLFQLKLKQENSPTQNSE